MDIQTKRVYESRKSNDGIRILVDRVWPRGMTKAQVGADLWLKDAAPGTELRKWFGHDRTNWEVFKKRYFCELDNKPQVVEKLVDEASKQRVTLLFSARDTKCNQAIVLREYLLLSAKNVNT